MAESTDDDSIMVSKSQEYNIKHYSDSMINTSNQVSSDPSGERRTVTSTDGDTVEHLHQNRTCIYSDFKPIILRIWYMSQMILVYLQRQNQ